MASVFAPPPAASLAVIYWRIRRNTASGGEVGCRCMFTTPPPPDSRCSSALVIDQQRHDSAGGRGIRGCGGVTGIKSRSFFWFPAKTV